MSHPIPKLTHDPISTQTHNSVHSQAHSPVQQLIQTGLAQLAEQQRHSDNNVLAIFHSDLQQLETDLQSHLRLLTDNVEQLGQTWRETNAQRGIQFEFQSQSRFHSKREPKSQFKSQLQNNSDVLI